MRLALLGGVSLAILATTPALAEQPVSNAAIVARLNALEAKVDSLEARNADLEHQLAAQKAAVSTAPQFAPQATGVAAQSAYPPARAASSGGADTARVVAVGGPPVTWTIVPQFNSPDGNFTFKPRGILDLDYAGFDEKKGGYDYNNGTQARRGRFGFDGTLYKQFAWRLEAEYVGGTVSLLDAYVAYTGKKNFTLTLGQLKIPAGLEANSSDSFNEFLERGMANTAFGQVGGERRVGVTFAYANPLITATAGIYGAGEAVARNTTTPDEVWGYNGRVTIEPINQPGRLIHLGASGYRVKDLAANSVTLADRPNVRVDNGFLESIAINSTNPANGAQTGVKDAVFYGLEGAGILGPVSVQGEYSHMHLDRFAAAPSLNFDGYYVFGSFFVTGESRSFKGGVIDRLRPLRPFDPGKGNWGAIELAGRYDRINLTDHALSPLDHDGHAWTAALNWYLTGNVKVLFNYIRFEGANSPLVSTPVSVFGTTAKGDAFATRVHLDF
ncbi:porin [uncultured Sphingomonas sp.]|uniref:porin n=1 Tax=uncultured Sphingomonas sp. TaxID=158754 RepID=UPI00262242EF|nr:porin [uncultured Sphingomonas sp.]